MYILLQTYSLNTCYKGYVTYPCSEYKNLYKIYYCNDFASLPLPISSKTVASLSLEELPVSYQADSILKQHSTGSLVILLMLSVLSLLTSK